MSITAPTSYVESLEDVYSTLDIYKSIVLCEDTAYHQCYTELTSHDFPVSMCTEAGLDQFLNGASRMLLVSTFDADMFHMKEDAILQDVNVIIFIDENTLHTAPWLTQKWQEYTERGFMCIVLPAVTD